MLIGTENARRTTKGEKAYPPDPTDPTDRTDQTDRTDPPTRQASAGGGPSPSRTIRQTRLQRHDPVYQAVGDYPVEFVKGYLR